MNEIRTPLILILLTDNRFNVAKRFGNALKNITVLKTGKHSADSAEADVLFTFQPASG